MNAGVAGDEVGRFLRLWALADICDYVIEDMVRSRHRYADLHAVDPVDHIPFNDGLILDIIATDSRPHVRPGAIVDEVLIDVIFLTTTGNINAVSITH